MYLLFLDIANAFWKINHIHQAALLDQKFKMGLKCDLEVDLPRKRNVTEKSSYRYINKGNRVALNP